MVISVLFFASYREQLGEDRLTVESDHLNAKTLIGLRDYIKRKGEKWASIIDDPETLCALNQVMVRDNQPLNDGDEVAFFPPVTGG